MRESRISARAAMVAFTRLWGVGRALGLGQTVAYADALKHGTHSTAGNHTGTGGGGHNQHLCTTELSGLLVGYGTLEDGNANQVLLSGFYALGNGCGDFTGLAQAITDDALTVADYYNCSECERAATLGHLGDTVDGYEAVLQFNIAIDLYILDCHND